MKLVILICLLIFSVATESRHLQKRDHEHPRCIHDIINKVGKPVLEMGILVMLAQNFPERTEDEHMKTQAKMMEVVDNCEKHPEEAACKKPAMTLFHDIVCKDSDIQQLYQWTENCCGKEEEEEKTKCFFEHHNAHLPEYKMPDVDETCKEHKEHPKHAFNHIICHVASRHQHMFPPAVIGIAMQYNQVTGECCAEEDKPKCFAERMSQIKKLTNYLEKKHIQKCRILKRFPKRSTLALTLIHNSQKFPNAPYDEIEKLTLESVHLIEDCCKGDDVECMVERFELTEHICAAKDKLSSNLDTCCSKPLSERTPCIIALPHEKAKHPEDMKEYYEDEHICENYDKDKTKHLSHFANDYARSHPDVSPQSCLRVSAGYEELLEKCCSGENKAECIKQAPHLLDAAQQENEELMKQNCGGYKTLGYEDFAVQLLVKYFHKMPQASPPALADIAVSMASTAEHCCALTDDKKQSCAEEKLDLLLGEMCEREAETFVNNDVRKCCVTSYAGRRPCFTRLGPYAGYAPPPFDVSNIHFTNALCDGSKIDQIKSRLGLLAEFVKMKPNCEQEKMKGIIESFRKMMGTCCAVENHLECFEKEKAEMIKLATEA